MIKHLKFLSFVIFTIVSVIPAHASKCDVSGIGTDAPVLCGVAKQGGMLYGKTDGFDVYSGSKKISNKDYFVIGLSRDAAEILELRFCKKDNCGIYIYPISTREYVEQKVNVADKFVEYPDDVAKRISTEAARIKSARSDTMSDTATYFKDFKLPENLKNYRVSGVYGSRRVFNGVPKAPHNGVDFAAPAGTPIYPIADGVVILADSHYMNGNIVMISHGHGVVSAYLHLQDMDVKTGDKVKAKTLLGHVGSTGRSSGAHLHLGLYWEQMAIDPGLFVLGGDK